MFVVVVEQNEHYYDDDFKMLQELSAVSYQLSDISFSPFALWHTDDTDSTDFHRLVLSYFFINATNSRIINE